MTGTVTVTSITVTVKSIHGFNALEDGSTYGNVHVRDSYCEPRTSAPLMPCDGDSKDQ